MYTRHIVFIHVHVHSRTVIRIALSTNQMHVLMTAITGAGVSKPLQ